MSENLRQSLSALMDNEADEFEVRRCLQQLDNEGAETWSRYQMTSALIKGEKPDCRIDLSGAVMDALADEEEYQQQPSKKDSFWKPLSSVAVAASVTAMVIFGAQNYSSDSGVIEGDSLAQQSEIRLPGPTPMTQNFLPAQYGSGA
ncbi:MAG: sigma-E factor negative regulatory protein, partial [Motiliproteus sp.]|nr:sigma-E factor negative regulatory protein [Motiliproteus sp.]